MQNEDLASSPDDLYLARMTMDEVGADIETHGHVAVTAENATQDPFTAKGSLADALDESISAMDADPMIEPREEVGTEEDEKVHQEWLQKEIDKNIPKKEFSNDEEDEKPDENGLVYLTYTITVDPEKYQSPNYQPIDNSASAEKVAEKAKSNKQGKEQEDTDEVDAEVSVEEKTTQDEGVESVALDYATFLDGSSFLCLDEESGVDYSKIAMDAGAKVPTARPTCKTTFAQCRAKNPLFCRYHGPKLLEKDIKTAIAQVVKGCYVSVTKDKGSKSPTTFRLTVGCPPSQKKIVEYAIHNFMTHNPGISSSEDYKDVGGGKQSMEFDMDILKADEPPKKDDVKGQASVFLTEKAEAQGKKMPVVGQTPPKIEKIAGEGGLPPSSEEMNEGEETEEQIEEEPKEVHLKKPSKGKNKNEPSPEEPEAAPAKGAAEGFSDEDIAAADLAMQKAVFGQETKSLNGDIQKALNGELVFSDSSMEAFEKAVGADNPILKALKEKNVATNKKLDAISKVKQALAGTGYEKNDVGYKEMDDGQEITIAQTKNGEQLYAFVSPESGITFGTVVEGDYYAAKSLGQAIQEFEKYKGKDTEGTPKWKPFPKENAYSKEVKSLSSKVNDIMSSVSPFLQAIGDISKARWKLDEQIQSLKTISDSIGQVEEQYEQYEGKDEEELSSLGLAVKQSLEHSKMNLMSSYESVKATLEQGIESLEKQAKEETAKVVDKQKGAASDGVSKLITDTASAIWPNGKPDGVDTVAEMLDYISDEYADVANGLVKKKVMTFDEADALKKKWGIAAAYHTAAGANNEFDAAIKDFKEKMDTEMGLEAAKDLTTDVNYIASKAVDLKNAYLSYKMKIDGINKEMKEAEQVAEQKKKLQENGKGAASNGKVWDMEDIVELNKEWMKTQKQLLSVDKEMAENSGTKYMDLTTHGKFDEAKQYLEACKTYLENQKKSKGDSQKPQASTAADPDAKLKAQIAAMPYHEKLVKGKAICEKRLSMNPNDEDAKKMLAKITAALNKMQKKDDEVLE